MARTKDNHNKNGSVRNKTTSTVRLIAKKSPKKLVKPAVYWPGIKSLLEIKKFQKSEKLIIKKAPFHRILDELLKDLFLKKGREATRRQSQAREDPQWAMEDFISDSFSGAVEAMFHAKRVTLILRDLHLAGGFWMAGILEIRSPERERERSRS